MKIIGVVHSGYNTARNISSLPFREFKVEKKYDLFKFPEYLIYKTSGKINQLLFNLHLDFGLNKCDIFHFFNTVSFGKKPWVTTFETKIPRFGNASQKLYKTGVKLMAGKSCRKLIAMSECARKIELDFIKEDYPQYYDVIEKKLTVIYPSQKLLIQEYTQKELEVVLSFIMVGAEFFRKGGMEVLRAFDKLLSNGKSINLYIISSMEYTGYATESDCKTAMDIIKKHSGHIFYYSSLPNQEVLRLFSKCHVALLPTYAETFGYSVLEAQASGCPVITTDIRALPEINNPDTGWVIPVPKDELRFGKINSDAERIEFSNAVSSGLEKVILDIIDNPGQIADKGIACIKRIKEKHSPEMNARELERIYNMALTGNL